jgi:hypothetical protein
MLDFCIIFACGFLFALLSYGIYKFIDVCVFRVFNKEGLQIIGGYTLLLVGVFGHYGVLIALALYMLACLGLLLYIFADEFLEKRYKNKCTNKI